MDKNSIVYAYADYTHILNKFNQMALAAGDPFYGCSQETFNTIKIDIQTVVNKISHLTSKLLVINENDSLKISNEYDDLRIDLAVYLHHMKDRYDNLETQKTQSGLKQIYNMIFNNLKVICETMEVTEPPHWIKKR